MADTITYFGDPKRATYRDGKPIVVNGRPLLIPENFDLQNEINAAHYTATRPEGPGDWFEAHYSHGSAGDPQRQAGYSGGFDPRYTDGGNYRFGLGKAAAGQSLFWAILEAKAFNRLYGRGNNTLPEANERASFVALLFSPDYSYDLLGLLVFVVPIGFWAATFASGYLLWRAVWREDRQQPTSRIAMQRLQGLLLLACFAWAFCYLVSYVVGLTTPLGISVNH